MKTPHAILIGLSLIAAAIFFKDTMTPSAKAYGGHVQKVLICDSIQPQYCARVKNGELWMTTP